MDLLQWQSSKNFTAPQAAEFLGVKVRRYNSWLYLDRLPNSKAQTLIELKTDGAIDLRAMRDAYHRKQLEVKK